MNVLQFTIPVLPNKNITLKEEAGPYFYQHLHRHNEMQLTLIQKGEGTLVLNNEFYPFSSGDIFFIGANQPHVFKSDPSYFSKKANKKIKSLTVFFNPDNELKGLFNLSEFATIKSLFTKFYAGFAIPNTETGIISPKINALFNKDGVELVIGLIDLLNGISQLPGLKVLSRNDKLGHVNELDGIRISNIYHYIMMNYSKPITLKDIAAEANMTPPAFCKYFKKRTMRTFVSFLNEVRVCEACQKLLKDGSESISLVAYSCGFNSIAHFNRIFKSTVGKSPSDYLKEYHDNAYVRQIN